KNVLQKRSKLLVLGALATVILLIPVFSFAGIGSPIHHYGFSGNTVDTGKGGNDGINYGATFVQGKIGYALSFDGVDDYVEIQHSSTTELDQITISALVQSYTPKGNMHSIIVTKGNHPNPIQGYSLRFGY